MFPPPARRIFSGLMIAGLGLMITTSPAFADLQLTLTVTGNGYAAPQTETTTASSGSEIYIVNGLLNTSSNNAFTLSFGGFTIRSLDIDSTLSTRTLYMSPFSVTNTGSGGTLTLTVSDDGFATPGAYELGLVSTATVNSSTGPTTFQTFGGNTLDDEGGDSTAQQMFAATGTGNSNASGVATDGFYPSGSTFSITNVTTMTLGHSGSVYNFSGTSIVTTPEPATMMMAATGLSTLGLGLWRRRLKSCA